MLSKYEIVRHDRPLMGPRSASRVTRSTPCRSSARRLATIASSPWRSSPAPSATRSSRTISRESRRSRSGPSTWDFCCTSFTTRPPAHVAPPCSRPRRSIWSSPRSSSLRGRRRADGLERRFGGRFHTYRSHVRAWILRWRPFPWPGVDDATLGGATHGEGAASGQAVATLYVAEQCGPCSEVRAWFAARGPVGLAIVAAERHPSRSLTRITYDPGDGSGECVGVAALGRALEHIHLGWALIGMFVRLPGVCEFLQAVTDASGGGPRRVVRYCELSEPEARPNRRGGPHGTETVSPCTLSSS